METTHNNILLIGYCNSCENVAAEQWIYIAILLNITYNGWDKPWWKRAEITTKTWTIKRENDTKYNTLYRADIEVEYEWYHVVYCGNKGNDFQISVYIWFYAACSLMYSNICNKDSLRWFFVLQIKEIDLERWLCWKSTTGHQNALTNTRLFNRCSTARQYSFQRCKSVHYSRNNFSAYCNLSIAMHVGRRQVLISEKAFLCLVPTISHLNTYGIIIHWMTESGRRWSLAGSFSGEIRGWCTTRTNKPSPHKVGRAAGPLLIHNNNAYWEPHTNFLWRP